MADAGVRVALLAKAGESRNQLRTALQDLGADLVCEGDPSELSPAAVSGLNPKVMVVSLEPAIEAALDKFEEMLSSSSIEVVYDDAEVSGNLTGWDLNRWARHLAAKIIGSDIMPPVPAGSAMESHDEWQPQPGAPETPAEAMADAKLEDYLLDTQLLATDVPVNESYSDALQREVPNAELFAAPEHEASLDVNLDDLEQAMRLSVANESHDNLPETKIELENRTQTVDELEIAEFDSFISAQAPAESDQIDDDEDSVFGEVHADMPDDVFGEIPADEVPVNSQQEDFISFDNTQAEIKDEISLGDDSAFDIDLSAFDSMEVENNRLEISEMSTAENQVLDTALLDFEDTADTLNDFENSEQPVAFSNYQTDDIAHDDAGLNDAGLDENVAALSAQLDEFEKNNHHAPVQNMEFGNFQDSELTAEPALEIAANASAAVEAGSEPASNHSSKFDLSSLALVDMDAEIPVQGNVQNAATSNLLKKNKFTLEAIDGEEPAEKPLSDIGAVLVLAGMGGPDAVRQLLKALPDSLNVPVLLYQHLEVGKHDRLVAQLQKVSNLPVYLAIQGRTAEPGQVAVLPVGIGVDLVGEELFFGGADTQQELVATLPAKHSVVIVLSGAAYETAAEAAYVQSQGGLALAQDPTNCFEPAAADALIKLGGKTAEISELATMVLEYFKR
jgi:chemosensory pili system protein ChpB (putative protein-glutamate methylesterase)